MAGTASLNKGRFDEAVRFFEMGLAAQPANAALLEARGSAMKRKEVVKLTASGERARSVGNRDLAQTFYEKAALLDRGNPKLQNTIKDMGEEQERDAQKYVVKAFDSKATLDMNFRGTKFKDAVKVISEQHNINFIFDPDVENAEVNVSAKQVNFVQAFNLVLRSADCFHKVIGQNSILVAPNINEMKEKYQELYFKTFHLTSVKAETMAQILTSSMETKAVVVDKPLNTVQVRDSREGLKIAERIVATHDRAPAEIMFDVEILEVNRSKTEQLGIDYGSQITAQIPQFDINSLVNAPTREVLGNGLVTLPQVRLNYLKNDVDARTLAKPRIRTIDGEPAKIHIGDKVPLRSSTVQDATGQTRTTFEYRDIGIAIEVLPKYHLDGLISVALKLEISSLGQNLGTTTEPAYSIGTRNAYTSMILREGEVAVLAGLIRDDERNGVTRIPGSEKLGIIGRLFSSNEDFGTRTDILLTISPHVLRHQGLPRTSDTDFYSGSKGNFTTQDPFSYLKKAPSSGEPPRYKLSPDAGKQDASARGRQNNPGSSAAASQMKAQSAVQDAVVGDRLALNFGTEAYAVDQGGTIKVEIRGRNLDATSGVTTRVLFNPDKLSLDGDGAIAAAAQVTADGSKPGVIDLTIKPTSNPAGDDAVLATLAFQGKEKGLSYLLLNNSGPAKTKNGQAIDMELGASRVEIR